MGGRLSCLHKLILAVAQNRTCRRSIAFALVATVSLWIGPGATSLRAQASSATLSGTVRDQSGAVVPDLPIVIRNLATAAERQITTDDRGAFTAAFLPPGHYAVRAEREGFVADVPDIVLNINDQFSIEIKLSVKGATESVTVLAEPSNVSPSVGTVIDRQFLANIPLSGRSLHALLQLVPGVVVTSAAGAATSGEQFSVNGQRTTSNYFMVDGVSANTGMNVSTVGWPGASGSGQTAQMTALGGTNSMASLDAVQEFRIETSTFAPEFGRTPGGQISLVTRGGTNTFHGSSALYFRNEAMDANDWFANSTGQPKPKQRQYLFSGVFGGPVRQNRVFFFVSYEGLRLKEPKTTLVAVPTGALRAQVPAAVAPYLNALPLPNGPALTAGSARLAASYSDPASFNISALRIDVQPTSSVSGFFRVNHAPSETETRIDSLSTINRVSVAADSVTGGATWVMSARGTADVRANWTRNQPTNYSYLDAFYGATVPAVTDIFAPGRNPSTAKTFWSLFNAGADYGAGTADSQRQFNVVGTIAWLTGPHQLKIGIDYRRLLPIFSSDGWLNEGLYFSDDVQALMSGQLAFEQLTNSDQHSRFAVFPNLSLYAQDVWHTTRRLTLTYGVRFERVPPPTETTGQAPRTLLGIESSVPQNVRLAPEGTPLWRSRFGELAPRLGGAYQLSNRTRRETILRAGVGVFHDLGLGDVATAFSGVYPFYASKSLANPLLPLSDQARTPPPLGSGFARFWLLDPNLRLPYTVQWNTTWEQSLGATQTVTVGYVGAAGRRLLVNQTYTQELSDLPDRRAFISVQRNIGRSRYDAIQAKYEWRLNRRLQMLGSYTLAHSQDNASVADSYLPSASQAALLAREWGASDFDVRHLFAVALSCELPALGGSTPVRAASSGWGFDLLVRARSSLPVTVRSRYTVIPETGGYYFSRPNQVPGQALYIEDSSLPGGRGFNAAAFINPPANEQGDFPRNGLRGFPSSQVDVAIRREFNMSKEVRLQIRAELFNALNHPNFGQPTATIGDPLFGQPTQMLNRSLGGLNALYQVGGPRSGELSVKVLF